MTDNQRYERDRATVMSIIKFVLMTALVVTGCFFITKIMVVMIPFLIGFLLAKTSHAMASPLAKKFSKAPYPKQLQKRIALVIYVILLVFIALAFIYAILAVIDQITRGVIAIRNIATDTDFEGLGKDLFDKVSVENGGFMTLEMRDAAEKKITEFLTNSVEYLPAIMTGLLAKVWALAGNIPYWIFVIVCIILSGYYFINDGPRVLKFYMRNIPNKAFRVKSVKLLDDLSTTLFRVIGGYLLLLIITTIEAWIAFRLAGVDYAFILGLITGVIDFMPVLGVSATMIPVMIYCAFKGKFVAIVILILAMSVITVVRRVIEPPILGKSMKVHPLLMLISMAAGVYIWGPIGFLLGPTVLIIIMQTLKAFGIDKKLKVYFGTILARFMKPAEEETKATKKSASEASEADEHYADYQSDDEE